MATALVIALVAIGAWWWRDRLRLLFAAPAATTVEQPVGGARPLGRVSDGRGVDARTLRDAFRSDEMPVAEEAERDDRVMLVRILSLLASIVGAHEAVLWQPHEGEGGLLVAGAWSRGAEPPALGESDRLLVELAASEQRITFQESTAGLRLLVCGALVNDGRGAVSVHFRETPALSRTEIAEFVKRFTPEVSARHELLRARAVLATRAKRLRAMIRAATTLQASRDPIALEEVIVRDACVVTGAAWGVLVRGNRDREVPEIVRLSDDAPAVFVEKMTAKRDTLVGEVFSTGKPRVLSDARALLASKEWVFDETPMPSGTRSVLCVAVRRSASEPCIGVLLLGHPERNALTQPDSHAAADLATIAAGALDTAWAWQDATTSAKTDQLTGLPNRRGFEEEFARVIAETDRFGGESALIIADVDHFKLVNDTYGHDAGDQVLKAVGATLLAMARTTDKVARLGGEELAILLPQTDAEGAMEATERCRAAIEALAVRTSVGTVRVTASFGVAMYAARSAAAGALFDRADQALYAAKHGGRNQVVLAPPATV
jgi:diguanylate cyclase (GGDEF)-like protein